MWSVQQRKPIITIMKHRCHLLGVYFAVTCLDEDGIEYISGKQNKLLLSRMTPTLTKPASIANPTLWSI